MPRRSSTGSPLPMSSPSSRIRPLDGSTSRLTIFSVVVLPQPLGPTRAQISPPGMVIDSSCTAAGSPLPPVYRLVTFSNSTTAPTDPRSRGVCWLMSAWWHTRPTGRSPAPCATADQAVLWRRLCAVQNEVADFEVVATAAGPAGPARQRIGDFHELQGTRGAGRPNPLRIRQGRAEELPARPRVRPVRRSAVPVQPGPQLLEPHRRVPLARPHRQAQALGRQAFSAFWGRVAPA